LFYQVETTRKIISFHKEDKSLDPNNISPQSILLDFISSSQTLRIWSFNTSIREHLNSDQLQKGKQIDEWWKQTTKGNCVFPGCTIKNAAKLRVH
jgi:mediator of RNA polymerase II transcription subunit 23